MILEQHGIFTWGDSARESYERMIAAVTLAEEYIARQKTKAPRGSDVKSATPVVASAATRTALQRRLSPIVRGALERARGGGMFVLEWRDEPEVLALAARRDAREL